MRNIDMKTKRFAPHKITSVDDISFCQEEYSQFKYGNYSISKKYGDELFEYFMEELLNNIEATSLIIYSSPYAYLPTASYHMTQCFVDRMIENRQRLGTIKKIEFGKINRSHSYTEDYGEMNAEERYNLIKNDTYCLAEIPEENATLLFLDDISITGTHQIVIENLLENNGIKNEKFFLYYATLNNPSIPANIENKLNYASVKTYLDLLEVVLRDNFRNTTRTTKYLLSLQIEDFSSFMRVIIYNNKQKLLTEILNGAVKNKYNEIPEYLNNLNSLKKQASDNYTLRNI
jgi:hypothetical protein